MKSTNFLPLLALLTAFAALGSLLNVSHGQNANDEGEIIIELDEDVTPGQPEAEEEAVEEEVETPAQPQAAAPVPPGSFNPVLINQRIARLETQAQQIIKNQNKIDEMLAEIAEEIRLARIYASRAGGVGPSVGPTGGE